MDDPIFHESPGHLALYVNFLSWDSGVTPTGAQQGSELVPIEFGDRVRAHTHTDTIIIRSTGLELCSDCVSVLQINIHTSTCVYIYICMCEQVCK